MKSKSSGLFSRLRVAFLIACALSLQRLLLLDQGLPSIDRDDKPNAATTRYIPEKQVLSVRIQADEQQTSNNNNSTTTITIGDSRYPYVPWNILSECLQYVGPIDTASKFPPSLLSLVKPEPINQSLGYIKTFKTGSSTVANLVNRIVDSRNLPKLIPTDHTYLGFPEAFPGTYDKIAGTSTYRAISNHAVLNRWLLGQYLRDPIITFTILREPLSRTISGYKFFEYWNDRSWKSFLDYVKSMKRVSNFWQATATNSMAYSLGWYHWHNGSREYDQNVTKIREFIAQLDNQMDLLLIVEKMDKSLLLLRDHLPGLALSELVHYRFKDNSNSNESNYTAPTSSELQELSDLLLVDRMIYEHFNKRLDEQWELLLNNSPEMENVRTSFVCLQERVQSHLQDNSTNNILPKKLRTILTLDSGAYTKILQRKQRDRSRNPRQSSITSQTAPSTPRNNDTKYAVVHYLDDGNLNYLYGLYSIHHQMLNLGMTPDVVSHVVVVPNHYNSTNLKVVEKLLGPDNIRRVDPHGIQTHIPKHQELWEGVFNKMFLFNLTEFDKVIALDLDVLVRKNILHWFDYENLPCGSMEKNTFEWNSGAMVLRPNASLLDEMIMAMHSMKRFWGWGNMFKDRNKFAIGEDPGNTGHGQQGFLTSFFTDPARPDNSKRRCFLPREAACQSSLLMNHLSTSMEYFLRYRRDTLETIHFTSSKPWEKKHSYTNSPFLCDMFREWMASLEGLDEYDLPPFDARDMFDECIYSNTTTESGI